MKKTMVAAAAFAATLTALVAGAPALAQDSQARAGHYEWRSTPSFGPRVQGPMRTRVWVADSVQQASCDCAMMHGGAADCMATGRKPAKG